MLIQFKAVIRLWELIRRRRRRDVLSRFPGWFVNLLALIFFSHLFILFVLSGAPDNNVNLQETLRGYEKSDEILLLCDYRSAYVCAWARVCWHARLRYVDMNECNM